MSFMLRHVLIEELLMTLLPTSPGLRPESFSIDAMVVSLPVACGNHTASKLVLPRSPRSSSEAIKSFSPVVV